MIPVTVVAIGRETVDVAAAQVEVESVVEVESGAAAAAAAAADVCAGTEVVLVGADVTEGIEQVGAPLDQSGVDIAVLLAVGLLLSAGGGWGRGAIRHTAAAGLLLCGLVIVVIVPGREGAVGSLGRGALKAAGVGRLHHLGGRGQELLVVHFGRRIGSGGRVSSGGGLGRNGRGDCGDGPGRRWRVGLLSLRRGGRVGHEDVVVGTGAVGRRRTRANVDVCHGFFLLCIGPGGGYCSSKNGHEVCRFLNSCGGRARRPAFCCITSKDRYWTKKIMARKT